MILVKKSSVAKKVLKIVGVVLMLIIFILYLVLPVGFGWVGTWRYPHEIGVPPEGFKEMTLTTSDNVKLQTWYMAPKNNCVIILLHGSTSSRENIRSYAKMLADNGFGVLTYDMRGHGESGGHGNAYGWSGTSDLGTAMNFLSHEKGVKFIGGLGLSMGGEVLLGASSMYPSIKAIVSDGATVRSLGDYMVLPKNKTLVRNYFSRVVYKTVQIISGDTPPQTIFDSISKSKETKFLFIAAGNVKDEIEYDTYFLNAVGNRADLWIAPKVKHTGAFSSYPKEYEKRIIDFFTDSLISNAD